MRAAWSDLEAEIRDGTLRVRAQVANRSGRHWAAEAGDALGWQVYDRDQETLLVEGPRALFPAPVEPRAAAALEWTVPLPPEDGRYMVFVSPQREGEGWFFEDGSPFGLIEADVRDGMATVRRRSVSSLGGLSRRRWVRSLGRAAVFPWRSLARNWSLIRSMVRRDISGRYAGSFAGAFWTIIHPLMMMLTYWFVFGLVLRTRFGDDGRPSNFVLYFLAGMLPWLAFSEAAGRAPTVVIEHANFVKKLVFPLEILPANLVFAGLFSEVFGLLIFFAGMLAFGREPSWTALWIPVLLIPQVLFTMGLSWFLAALGVLFRDLGQFAGFLLTVWFFITPICYPEASMPENMMWALEKNPFYILVKAYRAVLLEGSAPDLEPLAALTAVSLATFLLGHAWFYKLKKQFADLL